MTDNRPNIVLIMTDEMRGDCMGIAGHPDVQTPYLDSLASNGVYFPNAYTPCPSCIAARAVMHTGLSPRHCGRVGYRDRVDWNYGCTMAGELARAGYYTQCVGKMHVHPLRSLQGFHHIELHDGYLHTYRSASTPSCENQKVADDYFHWLKEEKGVDADITDTGLECNSWVSRPWIYEEQLHPTNWVTSRSIDFLRRRDPRKPFFLMASYVRPHAPYDAPQHYFDLYEGRELAPPLTGDWDDRERLARDGRTYNSYTGPSDPELIRQQQIGYYACITHVDHQIGRLIQALSEYEVLQNTVILFTSDHGEMLSDHCFSRKSLPYQGSIRIPLLMNGPSELIGRPRVEKAVAGLQDVMPTLLELAGAEIPAHLDGQSLLHPGREMLHGEHSFGDLSNHFVVTETDKYVWFSQDGREQYFRLDTDPGERHNAINEPQYAARIDELRRFLIRELAGREEGYTDGERLIPGRTALAVLHNATGKNC